MKAYEVLSRSSAFAVSHAKSGPIMLASKHVTHPHHYAGSYYADKPWLEEVQDQHIRHSIEIYKVAGRTIAVFGALL